MPERPPPTLVHVTHYKAGSQWIYALLRKLAGERVVAPRADNSQFLGEPVRPGAVYPTVYVTREQFEAVELPPLSRRLVVIRDLRDTLVSAYFSVRNSHVEFELESMRELRRRLRELPRERGLELLMDEWLPLNAEIQRSWLDGGEPVLRFEALIADGGAGFARDLCGRYGIEAGSLARRRALRAVRFERLSGGRRPGEADEGHHYRSGTPGEWRAHLRGELAEDFAQRFGELLIAAGYEDDLAWPSS